MIDEATDVHAAFDARPGESQAVVVVDALPTLELADLAALRDSGPRAGIVLLGPIPRDEGLPTLFAGSAWGYLQRDASGAQLISVIRAVAQGMVVVDPGLSAHVFAHAAYADDVPLPVGGMEDLTERERQVLQVVALGLPNKAIARRLGISEHTVKFHVAAILAKLGAGSRTEAVRLGARRGIVAL